MIKRRVGIFGGTFNPPHVGHVNAAKEFAKELSLDELLIIPSYIPPHKEYMGTVSAEDRLEMCRIAFSGIEIARVSDLEIVRGGQSFTYLTLRELYSEDYDMYFLVGTDMFLTLDRWVNPDVIFSLADICYIRREEDEDKSKIIEEKTRQYREIYGARIHIVNSPVIEISSTDLRERLADTEYPEGISKEVVDYIRMRGLYDVV